jgi:molybdenum cofactor cytidylyltransferase
MQNYPNRDFAIVLAAGMSTRMGVCKTTLPWHNNQTLLRYQAEQFLLANITPIIVLGSHNAYRRSDCPPGSQIAINFNSKRGKTSSILTGLELLPQEFSSITISAVDQPRTSSIYQTLLQSYKQNKSLITAPCFQNKLGHPLLFTNQLLPKLKNISDSSLGLRKIIKESYCKIKKIDFVTSDILTDINNKDVYRSVLEKQYRY